MKFIVKTKSLKADIAKKEITISFVADMTQENLSEADDLAFYVDKDAGDVEILITPRQQKLFKGE